MVDVKYFAVGSLRALDIDLSLVASVMLSHRTFLPLDQDAASPGIWFGVANLIHHTDVGRCTFRHIVMNNQKQRHCKYTLLKTRRKKMVGPGRTLHH